jgi:hypothetical protein
MRRALLCAALLGIACSNPLSPYGDLRGTWAADLPSVLGSGSFVITLAQSNDTVTGTGSYALDAGRSGTLTVRGDLHGPIGDNPGGPTIGLSLIYDYGQVYSFSGRLVDPRHMVGDLGVNSLGGLGGSLTLIRR